MQSTKEDLDVSNDKDRFKLWYELATKKSVKDLSYEFMSADDYFICYDEPSMLLLQLQSAEKLGENNF